MEIYVIKNGDTIYSIAKRFKIDFNLLLSINGLTATDQLVVGQTILIIYPKKLRIVKKGESLRKIAYEENISLNELYRNNPSLMAREDILEGQVLVISYENSRDRDIDVFGYAYTNIDLELLRETSPFLSNLVPFTYGFKSDGSLVPLDDYKLRITALNYGVNSLMHLSTLTEDGTFSNQLAADILTDKIARENLIVEVIETIEEKNYAGLDIDFEFVPSAYALDYAELVAEFKRRLNAINRFVYVALAPKTSSNQRGLLYEGHNYRLLSEAANAVLIMTYEWGYTYGPAMAVAPINQVKRVIEYALTVMESKKIFLGVPNYGYDFKLPYEKGKSRARLIGNQEAITIAAAQNAEIKFDEIAQTPYFKYYNDKVEHEVWFEDARSITSKLLLIKEYNLKGAGYWNLMRPFVQNWQILNNLFFINQ